MLTRFSSVIVWNGNDGADRIFSARDGVTSEDMRVRMVEGVATLAKEGQPEDAMVNVKFHSVRMCADSEVLKM